MFFLSSISFSCLSYSFCSFIRDLEGKFLSTFQSIIITRLLHFSFFTWFPFYCLILPSLSPSHRTERMKMQREIEFNKKPFNPCFEYTNSMICNRNNKTRFKFFLLMRFAFSLLSSTRSPVLPVEKFVNPHSFLPAYEATEGTRINHSTRVSEGWYSTSSTRKIFPSLI